MLHLVTPRHVQFTAGDLIEGLAFMEPVQRRAVLFGMEQGMPSASRVVELKYPDLHRMVLTPLGAAVVEAQPRHIRIPYVFWQILQDDMLAPVVGLDLAVRQSFGGMSWLDLLAVYRRMAWVDDELETEFFLMEARSVGLPVR